MRISLAPGGKLHASNRLLSRRHEILVDIAVAVVLVDRDDDGFDGGEMTGVPSCLDDSTTNDCRLLSLCLDLNMEASMLLAGTNEAPEEASTSDSVEDSLVDNTTDATPIQRPDGISLGGLVRFTDPEIFAIKTSTTPGRCFNNLNTDCSTDADCGGAVCVLFQDYLGVRGSIEQAGDPSGVCEAE